MCVSTTEVILTVSYFKPRVHVCAFVRELGASVVSGSLLLRVSVGADIEKTEASLPDTLLIPCPPPGSIYTPVLFFLFFCFAFSSEPLPNGTRP